MPFRTISTVLVLFLLQHAQCMVQPEHAAAAAAAAATELSTSISSSRNIRNELLRTGVIPDVLDDFEPDISIDIIYQSHIHVDLGNIISPNAVKHAPTTITLQPRHDDVTLDPDPKRPYTLALTDPDAPSRADPRWSEFCHWILTNITLHDRSPTTPSSSHQQQQQRLMTTHINGDDLMPYSSPAPPPHTGPHRYVFVLLQPIHHHHHHYPPLTNLTHRRHWGNHAKQHHYYGVRDWARENALEVIAANVFFAQNEKTD